ncbi:hypothetical protein PFLL34_02940 [Pseudomonas fluorescens]|nr:hypothetical protein PFLL34_02940 [Pseudomonas fluorescens]
MTARRRWWWSGIPAACSATRADSSRPWPTAAPTLPPVSSSPGCRSTRRFSTACISKTPRPALPVNPGSGTCVACRNSGVISVLCGAATPSAKASASTRTSVACASMKPCACACRTFLSTAATPSTPTARSPRSSPLKAGASGATSPLKPKAKSRKPSMNIAAITVTTCWMKTYAASMPRCRRSGSGTITR